MKKLNKLISLISCFASIVACGSDDNCNVFDGKLVCANGSRYTFPEPSHCVSDRDETGTFVECNGNRVYVMDGADGIDGLNGQDGVNGIDGLSGQDGVNGNDGMSGDDGTVFDPSDISFSRGGSRIKITSFEGNDGSILTQGFYDTQLGCECYPYRYYGDTQSEYRCVCSSTGNVLSGVFSDENCTQRLSSTNSVGIVGETIISSNTYYARQYIVGGVYTGSVYIKSSTNCIFSDYYTNQYGAKYTVGREMQASEFVGFSRTRK